MGRKYRTFADSDAGVERAAGFYTLIETAKLNPLDPQAFLRNDLPTIAIGTPVNRIDELMPFGTASMLPS